MTNQSIPGGSQGRWAASYEALQCWCTKQHLAGKSTPGDIQGTVGRQRRFIFIRQNNVKIGLCLEAQCQNNEAYHPRDPSQTYSLCLERLAGAFGASQSRWAQKVFSRWLVRIGLLFLALCLEAQSEVCVLLKKHQTPVLSKCKR